MNNIQTTKNLRRFGRFFLFGFSFLFLLTSCEEPVTPIGGGDPGDTNIPNERVILYAVGNSENRQTLDTEAEWDALLDQLCDQAHAGNEVTFYNISQTTYLHGSAKGADKESRTITTTSREEIKDWMKTMEKEGHTVKVTYDDNSGTWHGEAYATAPSNTTSGILIGSWHFNCMVVTQVDFNGNLLSSDLYAPEEGGGTMYYTFTADGTVTLTMQGMNGTTVTDSSTWSLSEDGVLYSDLLPSGTYWNVNWITDNTMILSSSSLGTEEGDLYYQLQFDAVTK